MKVLKSAEDYLETILVLEQKNGVVRSIDIASDMGFSKPSVSIAMHKLEENGYLVFDTNGHILLTEKGRDIAVKIYERHIILTNFLISLGVDEKTAKDDACKIEHDISEETFLAIKNKSQQ